MPSATKADSAINAANATNAANAANATNAVNAVNAVNAATVAGSSVDGFSFAADSGSGEFGTIGSVGGVSIQAACNGAGSLGLRVVSDAPSSIHTTLIGSDNAPSGFTNTDVAANSPISLFGSGDQDRIGWIVVTRPGNVVTVQYSSEQDNGTSSCEAAGTMVSAPTS